MTQKVCRSSAFGTIVKVKPFVVNETDRVQSPYHFGPDDGAVRARVQSPFEFSPYEEPMRTRVKVIIPSIKLSKCLQNILSLIIPQSPFEHFNEEPVRARVKVDF